MCEVFQFNGRKKEEGEGRSLGQEGRQLRWCLADAWRINDRDMKRLFLLLPLTPFSRLHVRILQRCPHSVAICDNSDFLHLGLRFFDQRVIRTDIVSDNGVKRHFVTCVLGVGAQPPALRVNAVVQGQW